jgi:hypothetical protein
MKRSPMPARTKPMTRGSALARSRKSIAPKNRKRSATALDQDFGEEAKTVRALPCLVAGCCMVPSEPAHVKSRGAGGGRFDIVPLCHAHHREQHGRGIRTFSKIYGLDLRLEADRVALEHSEPLGMRGLARRWAASDGHLITTTAEEWAVAQAMADRGVADYQGTAEGEGRPGAWLVAPLRGYDLEALHGWVRRSMERDRDDANARHVVWDRYGSTCHIGSLLGWTSDAWSLCENAGWPS